MEFVKISFKHCKKRDVILWYRLLWMWIKGSAALVALLILGLIFKTGAEPLVQVSSPMLSWILTFLLALTPIGAAGGYLVIWIVGAIFHAIFGHSGASVAMPNTNHISKQKSCPFTGKIYFEEDFNLFGYRWAKDKESLVIEDDWSITAYAYGKLGWIDTNGDIHDNIPLLGEIDPNARLSGGDTGLRFIRDNIWAGNKRIATIRRR